ncbi:MAG: hypothetical protein D6754_16915 [Alphaproteobacteria bacterium]|nr:MAG: hypothetical protein D6754_16915 [Alphaproteobacteria bacterium]
MRFIAALALLPAALQAADLHPVEGQHGTEGLEAVHLRLRNQGTRTLDCQAQLAHWFSDRLALIAPGESVDRVLWRDPQTGSVALLNERGDAMPVEALWCGVAGRAYRTRAPIALEGLRAGSWLELTCRDGRERVICR